VSRGSDVIFLFHLPKTLNPTAFAVDRKRSEKMLKNKIHHHSIRSQSCINSVTNDA